MRRQLVGAFVVVALFVTLLVGIPRAFYLTRNATDAGQVGSTLLALAIACVGFVLLSGLVGYGVSGRLTAPFVRLVGPARALGHGRFDVTIPRSRVPEAEAIGEALRESAGRLEAVVRKDREFAASASHVLRTPVTALRLDLEDLALWPQTPPEVAHQLRECLAQLDRLSRDITSIVDASRRQDIEAITDVDLTALVDTVVRGTREATAATGHSLVHQGGEQVLAQLPEHPLADVLQTLVDHVLQTAPPQTQVTVETTDQGTHLQVRITRPGALTTREATSTRGADLGPARELITSLGGYLRPETGERTGVVVLLPDRRPQVMPGDS